MLSSKQIIVKTRILNVCLSNTNAIIIRRNFKPTTIWMTAKAFHYIKVAKMDNIETSKSKVVDAYA